VLHSTRGRGTFIAESPPKTGGSKRKDRLDDVAKRALAEARTFGFTTDELISAIKRGEH
jgi:DNA-binding transcriptional regulator YhcF (GntR family)